MSADCFLLFLISFFSNAFHCFILDFLISRGCSFYLLPQVIACLDVRTNDKGDLVVTKGDQYDVREHTKEKEVIMKNIFLLDFVMSN